VLKSLSDGLNTLRQTGFVLDLGVIEFNFANLSTQLEPAKYERMIFGLIMILMMIFRPAGMIPEKRHKLELQKNREVRRP
jgi:branched-chain amino acid transport system permease protein